MSRAATSSYEIGRSSGHCAATGKALEPGEEIVVALVEHGTEGLERLDFEARAWAAKHAGKQGGPARLEDGRRVFAWWRSVVPEPGQSKRKFIDDEALLDMFEQLGDGAGDESAQDERARLGFRYVLALILSRKRLLRLMGTDGGAMLVLPRGADAEAEPVRVEDPGLDGASLRQVMDRLGAVMRGEA